MRHRKALRKFSLPSDQRRALLKGLTRNLIINDHIITTETRAKEVRPIVEKLVTIARKGGTDATVEMQLHTRRLVRKYIDSNMDEFVRDPIRKGPKGGAKIARNPFYSVPRLFEEIAPRYIGRNGGYTRIVKLGSRRGDGAPMVLLEFVEGNEVIVQPREDVAQAPEQGRKSLFGLGRKRN